MADHDPDDGNSVDEGACPPWTPCECTGLERAYGHHYACVYGPMRDLPTLRARGGTNVGTRMRSTLLKTTDGVRRYRVL